MDYSVTETYVAFYGQNGIPLEFSTRVIRDTGYHSGDSKRTSYINCFDVNITHKSQIVFHVNESSASSALKSFNKKNYGSYLGCDKLMDEEIFLIILNCIPDDFRYAVKSAASYVSPYL